MKEVTFLISFDTNKIIKMSHCYKNCWYFHFV